jgi:hypothetical protein
LSVKGESVAIMRHLLPRGWPQKMGEDCLAQRGQGPLPGGRGQDAPQLLQWDTLRRRWARGGTASLRTFHMGLLLSRVHAAVGTSVPDLAATPPTLSAGAGDFQEVSLG